MSTELDLALGLLDHQLLDCDGRRCGNVDDLEIAGLSEGRPSVVEILSGPGAWRGRGLLGRLAAAVARRPAVHVPWEEVAKIESGVHLRRTATELRLGRGDDRAARIVGRIPGAR
jgi:hypothetical protein